MSYDEYIDGSGTTFYLCWNCGKIHVEESETQHEHIDMDFIKRCLDKRKRKKEMKKLLVYSKYKEYFEKAKKRIAEWGCE